MASGAVDDPKVHLEQVLRNLIDVLEGRTTPEEIQKRPAAATVQSGTVALVGSDVGVMPVLGVSVVVFLVVRRRGSEPQRKRRFVLESWPRFRGRSHVLTSFT